MLSTSKSGILLAAALLLVPSCSGGEASSVIVTATATETATASETPTSSTSDGTESATSTSASSTSAVTTEVPECVTDEDCDPDNSFYCESGSCVYGCDSPYLARALPCSCGANDFDYKVPHPKVVLVIDESASMVSRFVDNDNDANTPEVTRWFMTFEAVEHLVSEFYDTLDLGLTLFPAIGATDTADAGACLMNDMLVVYPNPRSGQNVLAKLPPSSEVSPQIAGATPTRAAIELTVAELQKIYQEGDTQALVLITDGAANCGADAQDPYELFEVYDDALIDAVSDGTAATIRTFVIGVGVDDEPSPVEEDGEPDEINLHEALVAVGIAGGTANGDPQLPYYPVDDDASFADAMSDIVAHLVPCTLNLDNTHIVPEFTEIGVGGVNYTSPVTDCATEDGWRYVDEDYLVIELCGQACVDLRSEGEAEVHMWTC